MVQQSMLQTPGEQFAAASSRVQALAATLSTLILLGHPESTLREYAEKIADAIRDMDAAIDRMHGRDMTPPEPSTQWDVAPAFFDTGENATRELRRPVDVTERIEAGL